MASTGIPGEAEPSGATVCARMHRPAVAVALTLDKSSIPISKHRLNDGVFFCTLHTAFPYRHLQDNPLYCRQAKSR